MKKAVFIVLLVTLAVLPVAAKSTLVNLGYNVQNDFWGFDGVKARSISVNITSVGGDTSGFYFQANPYLGLSFKNSIGTVFKLSDYDETLFGSNFLIGYGGDVNFGAFGILLGGGLFLDAQYYDYGGYTFTVLAGFGLGANFYFQPGSGNFIVNAGLNMALHPWAFESYDTGSGSYTNWGMSTVNFNIGVGWRYGSTGSTGSSTDW